MPQGTADRVVRFVVEHGRCGDCGGQYRLEDVYVLAQREPRIWDLAAVCHTCHTLSLIRAVVHPRCDGAVARVPERARAVAAPERVGHELTVAEENYFQRLAPLAVDDVLDVSAFLARFDGDFRGLFGQEPDEA